jgi:hypothetical protein
MFSEVDGAIANGLTSVGAVSGSTSKSGSGSTSSACSTLSQPPVLLTSR